MMGRREAHFVYQTHDFKHQAAPGPSTSVMLLSSSCRARLEVPQGRSHALSFLNTYSRIPGILEHQM